MTDNKEILKTPNRIRELKSYASSLDESEYKSLDWKDSSFVRVGSIKGSSSIVHCILQSLLTRYNKESKEGKVKTVEKFRKEMAEFVSFEKFRKSALLLCVKSKVTQYPSVNFICDKIKELNVDHGAPLSEKNENLLESVAYQVFTPYAKEYNNAIGEEILEFLCANIGINVYIVDIEGKMKYSIIIPDKDLCIVLTKNNDDYEIIGKRKDEEMILYFERNDTFIKGLK
jgi:hypothetical protein